MTGVSIPLYVVRTYGHYGLPHSTYTRTVLQLCEWTSRGGGLQVVRAFVYYVLRKPFRSRPVSPIEYYPETGPESIHQVWARTGDGLLTPRGSGLSVLQVPAGWEDGKQ